MLTLTPSQRIAEYARRFPEFPAPYLAGDRIEGLWIMGNNYRTSGYYGAYPHGYLDRVLAMFPDAAPGRTLHLFSGSLPEGGILRGTIRFDINPSLGPDVVGDAHRLSSFFPVEIFDLILADPPYSAEDAEHYGTPMVNRRKVLAECHKILAPGGWLIWLDQVLPMFRKTDWRLAMAIGMVKSTNHRVRGVFGFQKQEVEG